ncbi:MAG: hypothetical protein J0L94_12090 [Rhodothermia bacterium]|nr:hypothetical protein [Rhodothermia bacterium]
MKPTRLLCIAVLGLIFLFQAGLAQTDSTQTIFLRKAQAKMVAALQNAVPVIKLENLTAQQQFAQEVALQHPFFKQNLFEKDTNKPLRNEIFGIYQARPTDYRSEQIAAACASGGCYRVEMYNYPLNITTIGLVNTASNTMLDGYIMNQAQPNIPAFLKDVALEIAVNAPEVATALGFKPSTDQALMSDTKTALNQTRCERSKNLCVAPTFVKGDRALWAIVNLTEMKLVGVRWTNVGTPGPAPQMTERKFQNEEITEKYCTLPLSIERNGWKMNYIITSSDGLQVSNASFNSKPVIDSAKLVDWHVSYSEPEGFGYSDAIGCPYFSTAAVIAIDPPVVSDLLENGKTIGFTIVQDFFSELWPQACNYKYQQRFEFYEDGRFRVSAANHGRGCGNNGTYRPVTRIAFPTKPYTFSEWQNGKWISWKTEKWQRQKPTTPYTKEGYQYKVNDTAGNGFYIAANNGQLYNHQRSDNAYVFVTKRNPAKDEGDSDLITIGPCCNSDHQQGPEKFMVPPESISKAPLVMWYVPQIRNDDTPGREFCWADSYINEQGVYATRTYPCLSGPMFVPLKLKP